MALRAYGCNFIYFLKKGIASVFKRLVCLLLLVTGILFICSQASALHVIKPENSQRTNISPFLEVLEDPEGKLTLIQTLRPDEQHRFVPVTSQQLNLGVSRSTYWFKFRLNITQTDSLSNDNPLINNDWILEIDRAWMPTIELWMPVKSQSNKDGWHKISAITADQSNRKNLLSRSSIFFIPNDFDASRAVYLKLASWGPPLNFSLFITRMQEFRNRMTWDFFVFGIIYGLMGAMILYNAFLFLSLRSRAYLLYVLYMAAIFFYLSSAIGHYPAITGARPDQFFYLVYILSGFGLFFAAWFCRAFLLTSRNAPFINNVLKLHMAFAVIWIFMAIFGFYYFAQLVSSIAGVIFPFTAIAAGLACFKKGFRPAGYFLAAWSVLSIGILAWALRGLGFLPQTQLITYFYPGAIALEGILLSLALGDRIRILRQEKQQLEVKGRRLMVLSNTDSLTKLYNKRYFDKKINSETTISHNSGNPLSVLMMDLDDFKIINDTCGHQVGDQVLKTLGTIILNSVREKDSACRYGGEEMIIILPDTKKDEAYEVAERIRQTMHHVAFRNKKGRKIYISISIGLAQLHHGESSANLINRADQALYRAKEKGKNLTIISE